MAIAKFTIEMAADLAQLKRDINSINGVVGKIGPEMAAGMRAPVAAVAAVGYAHKEAANEAKLSALAQVKASREAANEARMSALAQVKAARTVQNQNIQLAYQLQDFGVQIAGGQNPLLALAQQGSQLSGAFGGVGNAFKAVLGIFTPLRIALGGAVGAVVGLGMAFMKGDEQSAEFRRSLFLTGNAAGQTADSFERLIDSVSANSTSGTGKIREMGQAIISTGRFGSAGLEELTNTALKMASVTGQSVQEVTAQLVSLADSPAAYAAKQNKVWHFLTDAQLRNIEVMEANGKREEAVFAVREALGEKFKQSTSENFGFLERQLKEHGKFWDNFWDKVFAVGREDTLAEKIQKAMAKAPDGYLITSGRKAATPEALDEVRRLQMLQAGQTQMADWEQRKAAMEQAATEKRALDERLRPMRLAVALAKDELAARTAVLSIDQAINVLALQKAASNQGPETAMWFAEAAAKQELLKLDAQAIRLAEEARRTQANMGDKPEQQLAAQQKLLQISSQQMAIVGQRNQIDAKLAQERIAAEQKINEALSARVTLKDASAVNYGGDITALATLRTEQEWQAANIGKTTMEVERLTFARQLDAKVLQIETQALEDFVAGLIDEAEKTQRVTAARSEANRVLNAYGANYIDQQAQIYDATRGATDAVREYGLESARAGELAKGAASTTLRSMEDAVTTFATTGKINIKSFADTVISEFMRINVARPLVGNLSGVVGNFFGGKTDTSTLPTGDFSRMDRALVPSANGNVFTTALARGGVLSNRVLTHPTRFALANGGAIAGEAGAEGVLPLRRDSRGRLGVMAQSSGSTGSVSISIINQGQPMQVTSQRQSKGADGGMNVELMVRSVEDALADNIAAGSGSLHSAIGSRFASRGAM